MSAGFDRVRHQHRNRHRADTAGNGGDCADDFRNTVKIDVADEFVAAFTTSVLHPIDSDIDHGRPLTNKFRFNEMWTPDGGDDHVGAPANFRDIPGAGMNHRDRCVNALSHEQKRRWLSDDHAATEHDDVRAGQGDPRFAEQAQTTQRGARNKTSVVVERELCDIERLKSVHILARIERANDGRLVDLRRRRRLNKNAVNRFIAI